MRLPKQKLPRLGSSYGGGWWIDRSKSASGPSRWKTTCDDQSLTCKTPCRSIDITLGSGKVYGQYYGCEDACGVRYECDPKTNMIMLKLRPQSIPQTVPHPFPMTQQERTENEDFKMLHGGEDYPPHLVNPLGDIWNKILHGQNLYGQPMFGGSILTPTPQQVAPVPIAGWWDDE